VDCSKNLHRDIIIKNMLRHLIFHYYYRFYELKFSASLFYKNSIISDSCPNFQYWLLTWCYIQGSVTKNTSKGLISKNESPTPKPLQAFYASKANIWGSSRAIFTVYINYYSFIRAYGWKIPDCGFTLGLTLSTITRLWQKNFNDFTIFPSLWFLALKPPTTYK